MMWAHRMFLFTGEARYMDVLERTCFNGFISGASLSGDRFFYPNPLVYDGIAKNNHEHAGRAPWFGCACCPPNLVRTLASLTGYFYAVRNDSLYVNFYAESNGVATVAGTKVKLAQTTNYPWSGGVKLAVSPEKPATFSLRVRIPGWAQGKPVPSDLYSYEPAVKATWSVRVAGQTVTTALEEGYAVITREWTAGDVVELDFPMSAHAVHGLDKIAATHERVAYERGPILYCFEDTQHEVALDGVTVTAATKVSEKVQSDLLGGVVTLVLDDVTKTPVDKTAVATKGQITAIPYYSWNNRGLAPMEVWLKETR
jgi:DUF1680 family protein